MQMQSNYIKSLGKKSDSGSIRYHILWVKSVKNEGLLIKIDSWSSEVYITLAASL
jgi:hypothetical protein